MRSLQFRVGQGKVKTGEWRLVEVREERTSVGGGKEAGAVPGVVVGTEPLGGCGRHVAGEGGECVLVLGEWQAGLVTWEQWRWKERVGGGWGDLAWLQLGAEPFTQQLVDGHLGISLVTIQSSQQGHLEEYTVIIRI